MLDVQLTIKKHTATEAKQRAGNNGQGPYGLCVHLEVKPDPKSESHSPQYETAESAASKWTAQLGKKSKHNVLRVVGLDLSIRNDALHTKATKGLGVASLLVSRDQ